MKAIPLIALLFCLLLLGCDKVTYEPIKSNCLSSPEFDATAFPQRWQLVKTRGSFVGSDRVGADMEFQEFFILFGDSTFLKQRDRDGQLWEYIGTWRTETQNEYLMLYLTPDDETIVVGGCYSSRSEQILLQSSKEAKGTWGNCDGPTYIYCRTE